MILGVRRIFRDALPVRLWLVRHLVVEALEYVRRRGGGWQQGFDMVVRVDRLPSGRPGIRPREAIRVGAMRAPSKRAGPATYQHIKEELDLDRFEGLSWTGFHRHAPMVTIALAFPQHRHDARTAACGSVRRSNKDCQSSARDRQGC